MANSINIVSELLKITQEEFPNAVPEEISERDKEIAKVLFAVLKDQLSGETEIEIDVVLDFCDDNCVENESLEDGDEEIYSQSSSQDWETEEIQSTEGLEKFTLQYMQQAIECFDKYGFERVLTRFRRVKHRNYIYRFKNYISKTGTKSQKLENIHNLVLGRFTSALEKRETLHDFDLQRWGMEFSKSQNLIDFKASGKWVLNFKQRYNIVSRKITKFVTNFAIDSPEVLKQKADTFVNNIIILLPRFRPDHVLNTDQSGFNYLTKSSRMHTTRGEKTVVARSQSLHKQTHSYTIQPIITLNGNIAGKLYICLQEKDGKFGPQVQQSINALSEKCKNVIITCSASGKLHKNHVRHWSETVLEPYISDECLLILDSWTGQQDDSLFQSLETKGCERHVIPEKTTGLCQPLDIYGFRQWKTIVRKLTSIIALDENDIDITSRSNIVIMQSLIHNQLSAPLFKSMWQYSWYKAGYTTERPTAFENVNEALFKLSSSSCEIPECNLMMFLCCAHCRKFVCFKHFFVDYHFHDNDEMSQTS